MFRTVRVTCWGWSEATPASGVTAIHGTSSESQLISAVQSRFAVTVSGMFTSCMSSGHEASLVSASKVSAGPAILISGSRISASSGRQPTRAAARPRRANRRVLSFIS